MSELVDSNAIITIIIVAVFVILYLLADYFDVIKRLENTPHEWGNEKESKKHLNAFGAILVLRIIERRNK